MSGFWATGVDAEGYSATYPPDSYLCDTAPEPSRWPWRRGEGGWRVITDPAEAVETTRWVLIESEGWRMAAVWEELEDGSARCVGLLRAPAR